MRRPTRRPAIAGGVAMDDPARLAVVRRTAPRLATVSLSDVRSEERLWLFRPYIALGEVTALAGDGGVGKTTLLKCIAACVTSGAEPWTGVERVPAGVLAMFAEDDLATGVRADMERLGADLGRVRCITGILIEDEAEGWRLDDEGLEALIREVVAFAPTLVLLDPLLDVTPETVDTHKSRAVRELLRPLRRLARDHQCAVVFTIHVTKAEGGRAQSRVQGSADYVNFPRSVLMVAHDPDDPTRRLLTHAKTNLGPRGDTLAWTWDPAAGFRWFGPVDVSADAVFAPRPAVRGPSQRDEAADWLLANHTGAPRPKAAVVAAAGAAGISERALVDAYRALGGHARAVYMNGRRGAQQWDWPPIAAPSFSHTPSVGVNRGNKSDSQDLSAGAKNGHVDHSPPFTPSMVGMGVNGGPQVESRATCPRCGETGGIAQLDGRAWVCDRCERMFDPPSESP